MEHARGRGCQGRETNEPDSLRGNISPLGRDASLWSSVAIIWFNVWTRLVLYILKRNPYFLGGGGEQTFTTKTQEQSILIFLTNGAPHATSRSSVCSAQQPSPLSGQNAKWSRALSAADHKYWKEINFAGRKAPFFVLQPSPLPSHVDFGAVHTPSTCTFQLFVCQARCGFSFLAWGSILSTVTNEIVFSFSVGIMEGKQPLWATYSNGN